MALLTIIFRFPELLVFTTCGCRLNIPLSFSQQISYEFVSRSLISLISVEIPFLFDCKVPTEVIRRSSSHCAIGIEVYNLSYDIILPLNLCGIPNFELGISLFVTFQECSKMSALLLAQQDTLQLKR